MDEALRDYTRGLAIVAVLVLIALAVIANPMPWSPLGQTNHDERSGTKLVVPHVPGSST